MGRHKIEPFRSDAAEFGFGLNSVCAPYQGAIGNKLSLSPTGAVGMKAFVPFRQWKIERIKR